MNIQRIPKKIHQIYGIFDDGVPIEDIPIFKEYTMKTKQFAEHYGYEYKLWDLRECELLLVEHFPHYIELWNNFRYGIQRADFIRYLILFIEGGWYIDCDVYPLHDLTPLLNKFHVFTTWSSDSRRLPYNAVMGTTDRNPFFLKIMNLCEQRTYEKQNKVIYDKWKGRLSLPINWTFYAE
jgi:inositol phosphorylceramide mannosyltransferase catalytic subunit